MSINEISTYKTLDNGAVYRNYTRNEFVQPQKNHNNKTTSSQEIKKVKTGAFIGAAIGVMTTTTVLAKRKGFSLNPKKILTTPIKDWAIFNIKKDKKIEYKTKPVLALGATSVAGGFIGGASVDKKSNIKAKAQEALSQYFGNITVPICTIGGAGYLFSDLKFKNGKSLQMMAEEIAPQIKKETKFTKILNNFFKAIPTLGVTFAALGFGIVAGNKVCNFINEKIYKKEINRNIRATDFAPHLDDVCLASAIMAPENKFFSGVARIVPLALMVPGYEVGKAKEE